MPIEIIRRKEGELSQKQEIRHEHTQFSLNSYGHLCIREFDEPKGMGECGFKGGRETCATGYERVCKDGSYQCEHYKVARIDEEHLVVLDQKTTDGLIKFIFENRSTYEFKELIKELIKNSKELPF